MKKNSLIVLVLMLFINLFACNSSQVNDVNVDLLDQIKQKSSITVALEGAWRPWNYHDEKGTLVGFDTEVTTAIANKLGVDINFVEGEWDGLFAGLDSGRYDIVVNGVEETDERKEKYDFSIPYAYIKTALIVKDDNTTISNFTDLKDKTTCNSINSTYMMLAEQYGANVLGVESLDETLEMVISGRCDATLNAEDSFIDYMRVHPDAPLKIVALTDNASNVSIPMRKGEMSKNLKNEIDKAIEELRNDGTLTNISKKYFNKDIANK